MKSSTVLLLASSIVSITFPRFSALEEDNKDVSNESRSSSCGVNTNSVHYTTTDTTTSSGRNTTTATGFHRRKRNSNAYLQQLLPDKINGEMGIEEKDRIIHDMYSWIAFTSVEGHGTNVTSSPKEKYLLTPKDCFTYLAESSIPNSGLGMYAGINISHGDPVTNPEIAIPIIDDSLELSIAKNYHWISWVYGAQLEAQDVYVLSPGSGMLANSHLGLANANFHSDAAMFLTHGKGLFNRQIDPGSGAVSDYGEVSFRATNDILAGTEIFVNYGDDYFFGREKDFGVIFPNAECYETANEIVRDFLPRIMETDNEIEQENLKDEWISIVDGYRADEDPMEKRIGYALPLDINDLNEMNKVGSARFSVPSSTRSIEWLEENGVCMDNIHVGFSNIPQAGKGAFATRLLPSDSIITTSPLVHLFRSDLEMDVLISSDHYSQNRSKKIKKKQQQLLLNYCFGHSRSSALFFPYASTLQYINHGGSKNANARIEWSNFSYHRKNWLNHTIEALQSQKYAGLLIDIIALRDINLGEEVTIDYGDAWELAWNDHVRQWPTIADSFDPNPIHIVNELNQDVTSPIRTKSEQKSKPYPSCVTVACFSDIHNGTLVNKEIQYENLRHCTILSRVRVEDAYYYSARMEPNDFHTEEVKDDDVVTSIPRSCLRFMEDEYCSDQHVPNAFRQEISFPDDMFPTLWLDQV